MKFGDDTHQTMCDATVISVFDETKSKAFPLAWAVVQLSELSLGGVFPLYDSCSQNPISEIELECSFTPNDEILGEVKYFNYGRSDSLNVKLTTSSPRYFNGSIKELFSATDGSKK